MRNLRNLVAVSATMAFVAIGGSVIAQDDLDDLLNDLASDTSAAEEEKAEEPAAEAEEEPAAAEEEPAAEAEEEPAAAAEEPAAEAEEEPAAAEEEPAAAAEEEPAAAEEEPAAEKEEPAAAAEEPAAADEEPAAVAEEPAAKAEEEPAATEEEPAAAAEEEPAAAEEEPAAEKEEPAATEEEPAAEAEEEPAAAEEEPATAAEEPAAEAEEEPAAAEEPAGTEEEPAAEAEEEPAATAEEPAGTEEEPAAEAKEEPAATAEEPAATAEKPAATAEEPAASDGSNELLSAIDAVQKIRIKSFNEQADKEMQIARQCFENEEFLEMARHYHVAIKLLSENKMADSERKECMQGIADGLYRAALQEYATGRRERAFKLIEKAINRRHPKARRQFEDWKAAGDPDANAKDISEIKHLRNDEAYKDLRAKNNQHLKRARQFFAQRNLDRALDEVELVLLTDEYNREAIDLRHQIQRKRHTILKTEREATREGMMADVDEAWRPVYAVDAREVEEVTRDTNKIPLGSGDPERAVEQKILQRMKDMRLPAVSFKPPATIIDAVEFFRTASKDFDDPSLPAEQRGFNFLLRLPEQLSSAAAAEESGGFTEDTPDEEVPTAQPGVPQIPLFTVSDVSLYEALKLVCEQVGYKFKVKGPIVMVMHKNMSIDEMVTRSYPVLSSFMERMNTASSDMKEMRAAGASGFGGSRAAENDGEENQERDWKEFFELLGVKWPEGSSIMYIKTIGKLRVRNTYDNLAELEQALSEMNADPKLIEIETRFVEVCQEDLNSLGFEWILNSDYSLNLGSHVSRALGLRSGVFGERKGPDTTTTFNGNDTYAYAGSGGSKNWNVGGNSGFGVNGGIGTSGSGGGSTGTKFNTTGSESWSGSRTTTTSGSLTRYANSHGANWIRYDRSHRGVGVNSTYDADGTPVFNQGNRYLSTLSNHISGESASVNDQFMKINAFLGSADLSLILHMLSQRSDTDLLSAPKVLTQSGEEAVMKVVTEYIYPTDYDVQLQSSSSGSGNNGGSSQSAILAVVEPQSFTMREVGVILDVTPTLTDDGNLIDLELNTQVVDEPTWKNYGMKIPFTGNASSLESFDGIGDILTGLSDVLGTLGTGLTDSMKAAFAETAVSSASTALDNLTTSGAENMTYYDAPMEQPFFHVRSVNSKISVYPGATIVMGGLITEERKAMDDKVPFLGDIPFIGRLFRSHSEWTNKRNLLIFVTTRLVDTRGRELHLRGNEEAGPSASPAPTSPEEQ